MKITLLPVSVVRLLVLSLTLVGGGLATLRSAPLEWPAVTYETKPWSRWWWLGNISTEDGLRSEMKKYSEAGLGGLEITPIYGVKGYEQQFIPFLSKTFMDRFEFVNKQAKQLGMGIDMSTGTGWPFGGLWVDAKNSAKYLAHKTYTVPAGQQLAERVELIEKPVVRFAGATRVEISAINDPISANTNLQELALDQVRFPKPLPLHTLMAFPEGDGKPVNLTNKVNKDGALDWTAPAGSGAWTLYAIFTGWHGKLVERAGPGGEGDVIDHFDADALGDYLKKFDTALAGRDPGGFRSWFNDSYEVDDAQGESNFTPKFFQQFKQRRGYELREQLPALIGGFLATPVREGRGGGVPPDAIPAASSGAAITETQARVLSDYRETISDLMLDEFTVPWAEWAGKHGALIRNQAHGSPANILDLYAASGIPEQEGESPIRLKFASSAAHLMGKRLASSETATWLGEHFSSTLADVKERVDVTLLGGINHICYHGTAYSPPDDPWPGFHFYAAVELNPSNPVWEHFGALNRYVTRVQSFLQSGKPAESVLLYYPIHDRWAAGGGAMPHFSGPQGTSAQGAAQAMWDHGYTFDYISDRLLKYVSTSGSELRSAGGTTYETVLVPETKLMPLPTVEKLFALAKNGATVVFHKSLPGDVPGFGDLAARQATFQSLVKSLDQTQAAADGIKAIPVGKGRFLIGDDISKLLAAAKVRPEPFPAHGLQFVRRKTAQGMAYFIMNRGEKSFNNAVTLDASVKSAALFDAVTGVYGTAPNAAKDGGNYAVRLDLAPHETCILVTSGDTLTGSVFASFESQAAPVAITGKWRVEFLRGGPTLPAATEVTDLKSWTGFGGDEVKAFSGTTRYTLEFAKPAKEGVWSLDLGRVAESARVILNGTDLGTVFSAPYRVRVPAGLLRDRNTLQIEVVNLAANRIADLDRKGTPWKKFYNTNMPSRIRSNAGPDGQFTAAKWAPRESGLLGPVTLTSIDK